ncbi:bifunctional 3,4-dihydroxy-2-butanone 4-phosphate synthase/GTP cyclohydrolase II-like protein [Caballeronia fortuita]|uniref:Riboflavin biosynthesis protein RibBA n=1 Tax=Caballeronia fortuita TaxID=1777138 RepID=A0A158A6N2_9BURK|nr:bifunctional 3,4-dihydroxy-2-butanone-4-phosphate synthase/GTP cyclohydrolase II [Caballeronia fortuita]SAK53492.1 bifunctional 3,4-dihydroxy-2-butanone 4-phosphate synthase/GTP cyclohydrolase II-like protein [Caballeronia fortuita]
MALDKIEDAIEAMKAGSMVVVVDDEDRENEGDLILAAEFATPQAIAFMVRYTSGMLCVGLPGERIDALELPLMVERNTDSMRTAYTITVDVKQGTSTGISAADRAATISALVDPAVSAGDFNRPGHVFPLRAVPGGVLVRPGHTEAAVDLATLAGLRRGGVLAEVVNDDGSMARRPELEAFARLHDLPIISIADLVAYRMKVALAQRAGKARLPTSFGPFDAYAYRVDGSSHEHLALVTGDVTNASDVLVRIHSECLTGDVFGSRRCDCGEQLKASMEMVAQRGQGVVIYLRGHEGRGVGLVNKIRAYELQEAGLDTLQANEALGLPLDARDYAVAVDILADLGLTSVELLTNNPQKVAAVARTGNSSVRRTSLVCEPNLENATYLETKKLKLGHLLGSLEAIV